MAAPWASRMRALKIRSMVERVLLLLLFSSLKELVLTVCLRWSKAYSY